MKPAATLIGYGEAGSTFARAGRWASRVIAWDRLPERRSAAGTDGLVVAASASEAVRATPLVLSLVTADQAVAVVREMAPFLAPGALWCDMNSVAPQTKRAAAEIVAAAGGHYVDVAVLAPVNPAKMAVPLLVSGPTAERARTALDALGFTASRRVGEEVGRASAIKMIRSVMVKGIEALTAEMMLAAEAAGVAEDVLASLDASEKPQAWPARAAYNCERMATHGLRRAAEMEEAAATLAALGVEPVMTACTVRRQREQAGKLIAQNSPGRVQQ